MEHWKTVPDFDGYEVSSLGRVRSYKPRNGRGPLLPQPRMCRSTKRKESGYHVVSLRSVGGRRQAKVHTLVLAAFVGSRSPGMQGCHLDDDRDNNTLDNLYWGTPEQNRLDIIRNGRRKGAANGRSKLTDSLVIDLRRKAKAEYQPGWYTEQARRLKVSSRMISYAVSGINWKHLNTIESPIDFKS